MKNDSLTNWIRIARTGTHTDSQGRRHSFTAADFDALQSGYDLENQGAALCFGHPKDSDPAFGWVQNLKREGDELFAQFAHVPAEVRKLVDNGHYRYVSMSLSPDKKRLLHVGLLGAAAPAIAGLGAVSFKEENGLTVEFTAQTTNNPGGSMNLEALQQQVAQLTEKLNAALAENTQLKEKVAELGKEKDSAQKLAEDTAAEFSAYKGKQISDKRAERVRALIKAGKLEPAKEEETLSFAAALAGVTQPVNFTAADGKIEEITGEERFFRELEARPPAALSVDFSTMGPPPAHAVTGDSQLVDYSDITSKL